MKTILTTLILFVIGFITNAYAQVNINSFSVDAKFLNNNGEIVLTNDPTQVEFKIVLQGNKNVSFYATLQITYGVYGQPFSPLKEVGVNNFLIGNDGFYSTTINLDIPKNKLGNYIRLDMIVEPGGGGKFPTYSNNYYKVVLPVVVPPKPPEVPIDNNVISASGNTNFFDDFTIIGTPPTGGNGTYNVYWQLIEEGDLESNRWSGITSSLNIWKKDNTNYSPINEAPRQKNIYLQRKITSGTKTSYSNKILIYNYTDANKNDLIVKVKGRVNKNLGNGLVEKVEEEIDAENLVRGYFLDYKPDNMNSETIFRIANPVAGVRYKWVYRVGYRIYSFPEGSSIATPVYLQGNLLPNGYRMEIIGSDGSYHNIPLNTRH